MTNIKEELLDILNRLNKKPYCALLRTENGTTYSLKVNYNKKDYQKFLSDIDIEYDDGYGSQELYGTVWFYDNDWLERAEYDGAEWWSYKRYPTIPESLK